MFVPKIRFLQRLHRQVAGGVSPCFNPCRSEISPKMMRCHAFFYPDLMLGYHHTADLYQCQALSLMCDAEALALCAQQFVQQAGLTVVGQQWHTFPGKPGGVTGVLLLAESHLAIHTWPETGRVTLDIFVCNYSQDNTESARTVLSRLCALFLPGYIDQKGMTRGDPTFAC